MENVPLKIARLRPEEDGDLPLPSYHSLLASGMDVAAAVSNPVTLAPGEIKLMPTGFSVAIKPGFELQVRPRSGLAAKNGITVINAPGTIDADYRGEVKVALVNHGPASFTVSRGDRIAQLVLAPVYRAILEEVAHLDETERSAGGFGHTGI